MGANWWLPLLASAFTPPRTRAPPGSADPAENPTRPAVGREPPERPAFPQNQVEYRPQVPPNVGLAVGKADGTGWHVIPFPRTVIHPQFHPLDAEWLEFSGDPAPRMHRIRRDGSGLECLLDHDNELFIVHETFLGRTGNLVYTVWPKSLQEFNWLTRQNRVIAEFNAWHITPNRAGNLVLCDTNHPDTGLYLVDVARGTRKQICLSESSNQGSQWLRSRYALAEDFAAARSAAKSEGTLSWMEVSTDTVYGPQWTHPHPSFSSDESKVVFTSDKSGFPQVYVAELGGLENCL